MSPTTVTTHQFAINNLIKVALSNGNSENCCKISLTAEKDATSHGLIFQRIYSKQNIPKFSHCLALDAQSRAQ
jgi:hypothetical protein